MTEVYGNVLVLTENDLAPRIKGKLPETFSLGDLRAERHSAVVRSDLVLLSVKERTQCLKDRYYQWGRL